MDWAASNGWAVEVFGVKESERLAFRAWSQTPNFKAKVNRAIAVIEEALAIAPAYVACSWGKDSVVLLHLCQQVKQDIATINLATPQQELLDNFREVQAIYCGRFDTKYTEIQIGLETTMPTAFNCQQIWQDYPVCFSGLRAEENPRTRGRSIKKYGLIHCYGNGHGWRVAPLGWWLWQDVWAYIVSNELPYLNGYDKTFRTREKSRTTNVMPFNGGGTKAQRLGRIEEIRYCSPKAYQFLIENYPWVTT